MWQAPWEGRSGFCLPLREGEKKKPMDTKVKAERLLEVTFQLALKEGGS